ncbi:hypothetical protein K0M31_012049 [Melipona bicolor]|uniref:Uncharacterized protein n=1 Tax=Melipona bicolor TaxID=60889 RepID=A0AA40GAY5_9HYME|nr:hypothetical protein K0M31_012049 [Melipona bicolor]
MAIAESPELLNGESMLATNVSHSVTSPSTAEPLKKSAATAGAKDMPSIVVPKRAKAPSALTASGPRNPVTIPHDPRNVRRTNSR